MIQSTGQFLKKARINAGYSQATIAKKFGYSSPQFISNVERDVCSPPMALFKGLCEVYEVDLQASFNLLKHNEIKRFTEKIESEFKNAKVSKSRRG